MKMRNGAADKSKPEALSARAAADYIHELMGHRPNQATVWRWMQLGQLRSFHIGRRVFTTREDVHHLLDSFNTER